MYVYFIAAPSIRYLICPMHHVIGSPGRIGCIFFFVGIRTWIPDVYRVSLFHEFHRRGPGKLIGRQCPDANQGYARVGKVVINDATDRCPPDSCTGSCRWNRITTTCDLKPDFIFPFRQVIYTILPSDCRWLVSSNHPTISRFPCSPYVNLSHTWPGESTYIFVSCYPVKWTDRHGSFRLNRIIRAIWSYCCFTFTVIMLAELYFIFANRHGIVIQW